MKDFFRKVYRLYYDGFTQMTIGRTLWIIIAVKLFIMFAILKVFFFPDFLEEHAPEGQEAEYVSQQLTNTTDTTTLLTTQADKHHEQSIIDN